MVIYHRLIKPFVQKHEGTIDDALRTGTQLAGEVASKGEEGGGGGEGVLRWRLKLCVFFIVK